MSQQNLEVVVKQFEAANARDFAGVVDSWADDVALVLHGEVGLIGDEATGKDGVGGWFGDWFGQFGPDYCFGIEEARDNGDHVVVVAANQGHGRHSGVAVELRLVYVYTVREGKVTRVEVWPEGDREAALAAAGLQE